MSTTSGNTNKRPLNLSYLFKASPRLLSLSHITLDISLELFSPCQL